MNVEEVRGRAVVVGAGIGGLATAIGLVRTGWRVVVCERAPALEPVGTGLVLWPNGIAALDALGVADAVRDAGLSLTGNGIRRRSGRWLARTDCARIAQRHGHGIVAVERPELIELLAGALPAGVVRLGAPVTEVAPGDEHTPAEVRCGEDVLPAELVVAADGIGSAVRRTLWPDHPAAGYRGYTAWRAVVDSTGLDLRSVAAETWGRGDRFGVVPLTDGRAYVYATAAVAARSHAADPVAELDALRERFAGWHPPIPALLDRLAAADLLRHDVHSLEPPVQQPTTGRVALLGDAAHGMEPNLGQGACLALEDAVVLTTLLASSPVPAALPAYAAVRARRVGRLSRQSRLLGVVTRSRSRALATLRDAAVGAVPAVLALRGFDDAAGWHPPPLVPTSTPTPDRATDPTLEELL